MQRSPAHRPVQIGSVSYLNAKPLIYGLEKDPGVHLSLEIPAKLIDGLRDGRFDVALLPIIDYQRLPNLKLLTAGGIGSDGTTYTVRIFSRVPIEQIESLACDVESHTSVALARIILAESFGIQPEFVDRKHSMHDLSRVSAMLLIGDKVVREKPEGYPYQLDLGEAWKNLTGLPFVFAAWIARGDVQLGDLPGKLVKAREEGLAHASEIVERFATQHGWPPDLAMKYLTEYLQYSIGPRELAAIEKFFSYAAKRGIIPSPARSIVTTE